jgi:hypothetical protein
VKLCSDLSEDYVNVTQSCSTLWDPMDYSPWNSPGQTTGVGSLFLLQGNIEGTVKSEISQKQKDQNCEFPLLLGIQNSQTQKQRVKW